MLIDTHSHIYTDVFNGEFDEVIRKSVESDVKKILLPNIDSSSIKMLLELSDRYPNICYPMIGIHPTSVNEDFAEELEVFEYWIQKQKFFGVGEIGIDLYWDDTFRKEQEMVFQHQLKYAREYNLPVSIHIRESFDLVMENIRKAHYPGMTGVFHCFTGTARQAKEVVKLGFKIGVGGLVTFKNSGIEEMVSTLKPTDIVLETDAPYLAPVPFRGKRNESSYLVYVLNKVAEIFRMEEAELAAISTNTATQLFRLT
jgi:TatD DNase family protein